MCHYFHYLSRVGIHSIFQEGKRWSLLARCHVYATGYEISGCTQHIDMTQSHNNPQPRTSRHITSHQITSQNRKQLYTVISQRLIPAPKYCMCPTPKCHLREHGNEASFFTLSSNKCHLLFSVIMHCRPKDPWCFCIMYCCGHSDKSSVGAA